MIVKEVRFSSEGTTLRGLLFVPETQTPKPPLVIMAHGTSATVAMVADKYAEAYWCIRQIPSSLGNGVLSVPTAGSASDRRERQAPEPAPSCRMHH
jgi:hypothetical protein